MKRVRSRIVLFLYNLVAFIAKVIPMTAKPNRLLVIKPDEIGDYILMRNQFSSISKSTRYSDYKKVLVGNIAWKKLYDEYDSGNFDEVIWINKKLFKSQLLYRFQIFHKVRKVRASNVVNCIFSRSWLMDDMLAYVSTGNVKIAMEGDNTNRNKAEKNKDHRIYSSIIDAGDEKIFDVIRNRNFLKQVLNTNDIAGNTKLPLKGAGTNFVEEFFVLFIGAGNPERRWPIDHFIEVAKYTAAKYNLCPVICGGPGDEADAETFVELYKGKCFNYAGLTSLPQLAELLGRATFMISVDTGALHLGVAAGCPVIGLYSGKFYGRFAPYPANMANKFYALYPDFIDEKILKKDPILYDTSLTSNDTIKYILPGKVSGYVDRLMSTN